MTNFLSPFSSTSICKLLVKHSLTSSLVLRCSLTHNLQLFTTTSWNYKFSYRGFAIGSAPLDAVALAFFFFREVCGSAGGLSAGLTSSAISPSCYATDNNNYHQSLTMYAGEPVLDFHIVHTWWSNKLVALDHPTV